MKKLDNGDRVCGFDLPDHSGNRPVFAPETREQSVSKRGEGDKRYLYSLGFFAERSLHTGEVAGSIPAAPTIIPFNWAMQPIPEIHHLR